MEEKAELFSYFQLYFFFPGIYLEDNKYISKRNNDIILYDIKTNRYKKIIYETNYNKLLNKSSDNKILFLSNKEEVALFNIELEQFISILKYEDFLTVNIYEKEKRKIIISLSQKKFFVWDFFTYEIIYEKDLINFPTIEILNTIETKEYFIYLNNFEKKIFSINKNNFDINLFNINYFPQSITYYNDNIIIFTNEENIIIYNFILKKEINQIKIYEKKSNEDFIKNLCYNINKTEKYILIQKNKIFLYEKQKEELTLKKIFKLNGIYINYLYNNFIVCKLNEDELIIEKLNI